MLPPPCRDVLAAFAMNAMGKVVASAAMTSIRVLLCTVECNASSEAAGTPASVLGRFAGRLKPIVKLNSMKI